MNLFLPINYQLPPQILNVYYSFFLFLVDCQASHQYENIHSQYENMRKEELIQELPDINSSFINDINAKLTGLSEKFNEFTSKYDKVYSELQQCKSFNSHLINRIIQLEHNAVTNSQYRKYQTLQTLSTGNNRCFGGKHLKSIITNRG